MTSFANIDGNDAERVELHVPQTGPWWAEVTLVEAPVLSGRVTLNIGTTALVGTIVPTENGTRGLQRFVRVVGGAGRWGESLAPKPYANDLGVKALLLVQDAAREVGETLGQVVTAVPVVGTHYVRQSGPAARVLEDAIGPSSWWVNYDGTTEIGTRVPVTPPVGSYQVVDIEPRSRVVTLAFEDLTNVVVGSVLSTDLDAPQTVRDLDITIAADGTMRAKAWCGGLPTTRARLGELMRSIVERATDGRLFGKYEYRVVKMNAERVDLQVVSRTIGLPDPLPIPMFPGLAGAHSELTPGAHVLLEFIEGKRSRPIITGFIGKNGAGFVPVSTTINVTTELVLGGVGASFVALASHVDTELGKIATTLGTGANSGGDVIFATEYFPATVAATKVKAL